MKEHEVTCPGLSDQCLKKGRMVWIEGTDFAAPPLGWFVSVDSGETNDDGSDSLFVICLCPPCAAVADVSSLEGTPCN